MQGSEPSHLGLHGVEPELVCGASYRLSVEPSLKKKNNDMPWQLKTGYLQSVYRIYYKMKEILQGHC